jgi:hypothetical protein
MKRKLIVLLLAGLLFVFGYAVMVLGVSNPEFPDEGVIAYYSLDEGIGLIAQDSVGGFDGVLINGVGWEVGKVGNSSAGFSSNVSDYIEIPEGMFPTGNDPRTISAWIKVQDSLLEEHAVVVRGGGDGGGQGFSFGIHRTSTAFNIHVRRVSSDQSTAHFANFSDYNNEWVNIAVTYDGTNTTGLKFYFNGQEIARNGDITTFNTSNETTLIGDFGSDPSGYPNDFAGNIDEVGIWNRALTGSEILDLYNFGDGLKYGDNNFCGGADIDRDGFVTLNPDVQLILNALGSSGCSIWNNFCNGTDINQDGFVTLNPEVQIVLNGLGSSGCVG